MIRDFSSLVKCLSRERERDRGKKVTEREDQSYVLSGPSTRASVFVCAEVFLKRRTRSSRPVHGRADAIRIMHVASRVNRILSVREQCMRVDLYIDVYVCV